MPLWESTEAVHAKHSKDGYPLCWNVDQTGTFEGTFNEAEVTCRDCINYMRE